MPFSRYLLGLLIGTIAVTTDFTMAIQPSQAQSNQAVEQSQQLFSRGQKLYQRGKFEAAAAALRQAQQLHPTFQSAYLLGVSYLNALENFQAIPAFAEAIAIAPKHPAVADAYSHIGKAYLNLKQYPPAIAAYQQAVLRQSQNATFQENLGIAYHLDGQYDKAIAAYQQALRLKPDNPDIRKMLQRAQRQST